MALGDTPIYTPNPPTVKPQQEDTRNIATWVQQELNNISNALNNITRLQITPVSAPPPTPREGLLAYADGISWNPNSSGKGIATYDAVTQQWRQFPQLNVNTIVDANYNILPQDELLVIIGFTAPRTFTLPNPTLFAGRELVITGIANSLSATNTLTIQHHAAEFIDIPPTGVSATSIVINTPMPYVRLTSDGSNWFLWQLTAAASDPIFGASGGGHAAGDVPDPGAVAGTTRFLREDATWVAPPAVPALNWVLLNTVTASNSASLDDTTSLTNAYNKYAIMLEDILPVTNGVAGLLRVISGGVTQTLGYVSGGLFVTTYIAPVTNIPFGSTTASILISNSAPGVNALFFIQNPSGSGKHMVWGHGAYRASVTAETVAFTSSGCWDTAGVVTGVDISLSVGNIASGVMKVYGIL